MNVNKMSEDQIIKLLSIDNLSPEYYNLLWQSNQQSSSLYGNKGYVFAQIGINAEPCSVNCKFCSMGSTHYVIDGRWQKSTDQVIEEALMATRDKIISDLFLMTTADYPAKDFLEIGHAVKAAIGIETRMVANIGDFDELYAEELIKAGFTGIYHIVRLGEGSDTEADPEQRLRTISAAQSRGLELYYCIEPIGPEHSYSEIAKEIIRAQDLGINVMAVMRRTAVKGTPFEFSGEISIPELCKIAAVTALAVKPKRSMNVHETTELSLISGVNQLYAEIGANPRDVKSDTEFSRGMSVLKTAELLTKYGFEI